MSHKAIPVISQEDSRKWLQNWINTHATVNGWIIFDLPSVACAKPNLLKPGDVDVMYWDATDQEWHNDATVWAFADHYEYRFFGGVPANVPLRLKAEFHPWKAVTPECAQQGIPIGHTGFIDVIPLGWSNPLPAPSGGSVLDSKNFMIVRRSTPVT